MGNPNFIKVPTIEMPRIVVSDTETGKHYTFFIFGGISEPSNYTQMVSLLLHCTKNDIVDILIDTPGGYVNTGQYIVSAMKRCKALVRTTVVGHAYSCGALIWSFGNERYMGDLARVMYHATSHGDMGRSTEIKDRAEGIIKGFVELLEEIKNLGILTEEMMTSMVTKRMDLFLNKSDLQHALTTEDK